MLTKRQYSILKSCADDSEIFFYLYAASNMDSNDEFLKEDKRVSAEEIIDDIVFLINEGYLQIWRNKELLKGKTTKKEFDAYQKYRFTSFEQHIDKFNYGPHEFQVTEKGFSEVQMES